MASANNIQSLTVSDTSQNSPPISSSADSSNNTQGLTQSSTLPNETNSVQQQDQNNNSGAPATTINGKSSFRRVKARSSRACEV